MSILRKRRRKRRRRSLSKSRPNSMKLGRRERSNLSTAMRRLQPTVRLRGSLWSSFPIM
ncbi:unnamed protein product [Brassica rapa]|uniref:Uncharacterized protein n=1 Tax=Brassica campestris TaxID=3711 RepID=A0A3P6BAZ3_BRACM|nr:unnamed protein product [Brassica rapa]VDD03257.1 unnamed protein product [Brassica rapa]